LQDRQNVCCFTFFSLFVFGCRQNINIKQTIAVLFY
jgi:hypothetical protein